ncbi:hypothetical protein DLAC_08818 [Tieghemostelium lacteum]|uniref:PPIase cyclophilin-type domain-containing protein n=1 Tax=Tieghemostelium lacteum TaxID=361077 RepID=A0A151Z8F0_TIELA|nr:hypothetical protein DLAC_08818 [Tieghemostelium lacteum]|eukprot:KYQ90217.1 hypothetical protein DLAC_08818 [Tieghemostelium lacteum]
MSSNGHTIEPDTNGKVLLKTTLGDIEIELWGKETPMTCRNFIQLCMEGYYNGCIFHRLVKDFIAQTGDPTATGTGGESTFNNGQGFKDEFHSRLRFNRRGLVGMASSTHDDNRSQFFFTLGKADDLNKKHTLFGRIIGDTLFNLLQINEMDVDDSDRPLFPPKILACKVIANPFDDLKPRDLKPQQQTTQKQQKKKKPTTKNLGLLSFGDEEEPETEDIPKPKPKPISQQQEKPLKKDLSNVNQNKEKDIDIVSSKLNDTTADINSKTTSTNTTSNDNGQIKTEVQNTKDDIQTFSDKMRSQIIEREKKREREGENTIQEKDKDVEQPKEKKKKIVGSLSFKTVSGKDDYRPTIKSKVSDMSILEKLNKFKTTISNPNNNNNNNNNIENDENNENNESWKSHTLKYKKNPHDFYKDREDRDRDDYIYYDPLLDKSNKKNNNNRR